MRVSLSEKKRRNMRNELTRELSSLRIKGHYTICNHLRLLYKTLTTDYQKELCEEIIYLAKRMSKRLEELHGHNEQD